MDVLPADKKRRAASPAAAGGGGGAGRGAPSRGASPAKKARPAAGADEDDDDEEVDSLTPIIETFRKEAIYRQMLEYKRMNARSAARVAELERRRTALQAGMQGIEVCWSELLEAVRGLVGTKELPAVASSLDASPIFTEDPEVVPELRQAVDQRSQSTKELLVKFVELAERGVRASQDELRERSGAESKKSATLASSLHVLQAQLASAKADQDRTYADLLKAEKQLDRLRCQSIVGRPGGIDGQSTPAAGPSSGSAAPTPAPAGSDVEMKGPGSGVPSPAPPKGTLANGSAALDPNAPQPSLASLVEATLPDPADRALADSRLEEIERLRAERVRLEQTVDRLRLEVDHPPEHVVSGTALFKALLAQLDHYQTQIKQAREEYDKLVLEADGLRDDRRAFEAQAASESQVEVDSLRTQLLKREQDLGRLRGERDDLLGKLNEKKARESVKLRHVDEMEALVRSADARMGALKADIARLKAKLGAEAGSESLFAFLLKEAGVAAGADVSEDYHKGLEASVAAADARIAALTTQVSQLAADPSLLAALTADSQARQDLAALQVRAAAFEKVLGPDPAVAQDAAALVQSLQAKQAELETMERKLKENEMATDALYSEVERLSTAWEEATAHAQKKVFGLKEMEEKLAKALNEKAKADNKYFAAMRTKDAVDGEKKVLARNAERQTVVIEKLSASEKSLGMLLAEQEKKVTLLQRQLQQQQSRADDLQRQSMEAKGRLDGESARAADLEKVVASKAVSGDKDRAALMRAEEELARARRDAEKAEKALAKMKAAVSSAAASGTATVDPELREERDKLYSILRCSTCSLRLRSHCITKCMHTFCKDCIDSRITTRQRKCPACNLAFAVSDVAQVYFQ